MVEEAAREFLQEWGAYGAILVLVLWFARDRAKRADEQADARLQDAKMLAELVERTSATNEKVAVALGAMTDEVRRMDRGK